MKKLLAFTVLGLLWTGSVYAETLTLNCSFNKFVQFELLKEKIIPKNELPAVITDDKFITLETKSNNNIKIKETSFMIGYEIREPEERIIIPFEINDNFIRFKEKDSSVDEYSLNRYTGQLLINVGGDKLKTIVYYTCVKKDKLL